MQGGCFVVVISRDLRIVASGEAENKETGRAFCKGFLNPRKGKVSVSLASLQFAFASGYCKNPLGYY